MQDAATTTPTTPTTTRTYMTRFSAFPLLDRLLLFLVYGLERRVENEFPGTRTRSIFGREPIHYWLCYYWLSEEYQQVIARRICRK